MDAEISGEAIEIPLLAEELAFAWIRLQIHEVRDKVRLQAGVFRDGWEAALEEIDYRIEHREETA